MLPFAIADEWERGAARMTVGEVLVQTLRSEPAIVDGMPRPPPTPMMRGPATAISRPHPIEHRPQVDGTQRSIDAPLSTWENGVGRSEAISEEMLVIIESPADALSACVR
jgi:hypothetical protein